MSDIEYWIILFGLVSPWVLILIYSIDSLKEILKEESENETNN